jgi:hypothetical protein
MSELVILGPTLTLILLVIVILLGISLGKRIIWLIINSVIGLIALLIVNLIPGINITINIWSVLIVVFGGIPGIILLILLDVLKIAF